MQENYANDDTIRYTYSNNGDVTAQYKNDNSRPYVTYTYNDDGDLTEKVNTDTGLKYVYDGDNVSVYKTSDNSLVQSYTSTETEANEETGTEAYTTVIENHFGTEYTSVSREKSVSYTAGDNTAEYSYQTTGTDEDGKLSADSVKYNDSVILSSAYTYDDNGNVLSKSYGESNVFTNTYDDKDRITSTSYAGKTYNYTYDTDSQLTGVTGNNYTASYEYNDRGNITSKTVNGATTSFTYANSGWKDLLVSVNGTELTYDANGNVLTYGDKEYTWNTGRHLESITDGENTYSYAYDEDGIRTSKTVNGVTTYYNTKDGVILSQTDGTNTMYFQYDTSGVPLGFIWNGTQYLYMTNQMGDVISVTDAQGVELVQYEYDEWGTLASIYTPHNSEAENAVANINPLRYRGYYYDTETGYYYLQSRYYDASICRFINADNYCFIDREIKNGTNLFEYSLNDPINYIDPTGNYSAKNATSYANKWWNSYNTSQYKTNSSDCANFVLQCLYAGGLSKKTTKWFANKYKITNAWGTVNGLYTWLFNQNFVKTVYILSKKSDVEKTAKEIKTMSRCTSVIFFDKNKADGKLNHAAIIGKISYTNSNKDIAYYAHTNPRNGTFSGEGASSLKSYLDNKSGSKIVYIVVISFTFG